MTVVKPRSSGMTESPVQAHGNAAAKASDPTFRNYNTTAASAYLTYRPQYSNHLIQMVIGLHTSTGGGLESLLDVGCGPGNSTGQLAPFFDRVTGVDPGEGMISAARAASSAHKTRSGQAVHFQVCDAENLTSLCPWSTESSTGTVDTAPDPSDPGQIDLITCATSAHWFDMPRFYREASLLLKPAGSIAMWCSGEVHCNPHTTPNAKRVQNLLDVFLREELAPFEQRGNKHCTELYDSLPMPWTIPTSVLADDSTGIETSLSHFEKSASVRIKFNRHGEPGYTDPVTNERHDGYLRFRRSTFDESRQFLGTASSVTRWREAHREQLDKGEIEDCVEELLKNVWAEMNRRPRAEDISSETGQELTSEDYRDWIDISTATVLLVIKKRK